MTPAQELIAKLAAKFPDVGNKTLARMAYTESPELFANIEAARTAIRQARSGRKHRTQYLPARPGKAGDAFPKLPEGKTHFDKWGAVVIPGPMRALVLSDLHIPYHDRAAILAAIDYGKKQAVDTIILNGDTADFFSVSFWEKDPRKRRFSDELKMVKEFVEAIRESFPKARMVYKLGNHEERWERYMFVKAPELLGVPEFEIGAMLGLNKAEIVAEKRPLRIGQLNVIHGHEYRFAISNPVNPARGLFLRCKAYAMCGHFHQTSQHSDKTVEQKSIGTWSTGCLCDLHPDYSPMNNWNHGFAFVEVFNDGKFNVKNCFISSSGKVY